MVKIRWRSKDENELKRLVKNFNAKLEYQKKAHPELAAMMPERASYKDMRKSIQTRKELKRELQRLRDFTTRGSTEVVKNKNGVEMLKYDLKQLQRKVRRVNAGRAKRRKIIEESGNIATGITTTPGRQISLDNQKPIESAKYIFSQMETNDNFDKFSEYLENEIAKDENNNRGSYAKDIVKQSWETVFSPEAAKKLSDMLDNVRDSDFEELALLYPELFSPQFVYVAQKTGDTENLYDETIETLGEVIA